MRKYSTQLKSSLLGAAIALAGGAVIVTAAGGTAKATLYNDDGTALANPVALNKGHISFNVADSVDSVDLYIVAPTGHGIVEKAVKPSGDNAIYLDTSATTSTIIVPFDVADQAGDATETDTGVDLVANSVITIGNGLNVVTVDATETIGVGLLSSESGGDADGIIALGSVATAGAVTSTTIGAAGLVVADAVSLSYTLTAGSDTAAGFIKVPVLLPVASL